MMAARARVFLALGCVALLKGLLLSIRVYIKLTGFQPQVLKIVSDAARSQIATAFAPGSG
jgi:hypothetical protein